MTTKPMGTAVLAFAWCAAAGSLAAQTRHEPQLVFSISAGLTTGQHLWKVEDQPLLVAPTGTDTVTLQRYLTPGLTAALGITYFPSPSLGYMVEIGYFGLTGEQRCAGPAEWLPGGVNQAACEAAQGRKVQSGIVAFQAGITYRFSGGATQPYVRLTAGGATLGPSFVNTNGWIEVESVCPNGCEYPLMFEDESREITYSGTIAAGLIFWLAPAYRLRLEVRDLIAGLPVATGPAPPPYLAPTDLRLVHTFVLTAGLDVVLERRHERRY
jgi:hypothetical protein